MANPVDVALTLDAESLARAERYSWARGTNVSDVVNAYLRGPPEPTLPPSEWERGLPPHTARLREVARRGDEDAVHAAAARRMAADFVVTRDLKHFRTSPVRAMLPADVLRLM